jgi:hypothetical protein
VGDLPNALLFGLPLAVDSLGAVILYDQKPAPDIFAISIRSVENVIPEGFDTSVSLRK